ncbi:replicative DNA helicase [Sphingomonas sp.]|uniref:replicative DNA helicase n=1 Tax=Sphingomonas sp. TaxID=28214 RepID=UPI0035C8381D
MNRTARIHDDPIAYPENLRPVEGEMMMLAMLLNDNSRVDIVADLLRSDDFYEPLFGRLYGRIVQLVSAGQQANPFTVNALFANDPAYAEMNAREMLVDLTGTEARASLLIRAVDQATVIAEAAARRRLISVTRELEQRAADADVSVPQLVDETDAALIAATERRDPSRLSDFKSAIGLALTRIERIKANEGKVGATTGIEELDDLVGGFEGGQLVIVGGRPGMGKTGFACSVSNGLARNGHGVFFQSLEMKTDELSTRMLCDVACRAPSDWVPFSAMVSGRTTAAQDETLAAISQSVSSWPVEIDDRSGVSIARLALSARRVRRKMLARKQTLRIIIVDYLQLMAGEDKRASIYETVTAISKGLKELAKELNVTVIALAQLSRAVEQRDDKRPMLSDLKDSGQLEQDADAVIFLYREEYYLKKVKPKPGNEEAHERALEEARGKIVVHLAKRRNGAEGSVTLRYLAPYQAIRGSNWGRL